MPYLPNTAAERAKIRKARSAHEESPISRHDSIAIGQATANTASRTADYTDNADEKKNAAVFCIHYPRHPPT
jgi:hypothetical protein